MSLATGKGQCVLRESSASLMCRAGNRSAYPWAQGVKTEDGRQWRVRRRFRIAGEPIYRLTTRGWRWVVSEQILMAHIEAAQQGG